MSIELLAFFLTFGLLSRSKKPTAGKLMNYHYSIIIQWSEEDRCFVVSLPEWGEFCHTHGNTYEEALKNAQKVLQLLIDSSIEEGETLPTPKLFGRLLQTA
jgi:antitoxin HicB